MAHEVQKEPNMANRTMTADQLVLRVLLAPRLTAAERQTRLTRLAHALSDAVNGRVPCPDCGHRGPHDDNGDRREPMLCCCECGSHFDAPTTMQVAL